MDWLEKLAGYAPDIAAAVATGGSSIALTGLRILGKELLGDEEATEEQVKSAVESATPAQMAAVRKADQDFALAMRGLQAGEMKNARDMYKANGVQADKIADRITKFNVAYIMALVVVNCLVVYFLEKNAALVAVASNIIGLVIRDLLAQIQAVTGFYFGSSLGSKEKDGQTPVGRRQ